MATSPEERVELARRGFEAYTADDVASVLELLDPGIEVYAAPTFMNAGTFHGHEGWLEWVRAWNEAWESFAIEVEECEAVGDHHVVTTVRQTGRGRSSGIEIELDACYVHEVREGRAVYLGLYASREEGFAAARERELGSE